MISSHKDMINRVYQITKGLIQKRKFVVMLDGEHSLSLGAVQAFKETFFELCPIVQVGVRSLSWEEKQFLNQNRMTPSYMSDLASSLALAEQIAATLSKNVYLTIDVDVFDPSIMPVVGTPEPGGMPWQQVLNLLRLVALHKHIIGFDLMDSYPQEGPASCAFLLAKLAYKLIGYAMPQNKG